MAISAPRVPVDPAVPPDTGLIGREQDLETVEQRLTTSRLVTLMGPAGVGKTSLATLVAARHQASPVAMCQLAPVSDSDGVPSVIAESLGFPTLEAAAVGLVGEARLLVVDNVEHHVDVAARAIEGLLAACPGLTVLVTSQQPLEVAPEHVLVLETLPVPPDDDLTAIQASPAVQLFLARARAAGAAFDLDEAAVSTAAAIVRTLDGLPLAIELAAARTRSLGLRDILRHLDARFELLTRRHDRGPARHRSLEAAIGWSYERLEPAIQRFFARLGAFCGPFSLEAAHTVAAEADDTLTVTLDRLDVLVSRSLISLDTTGGESSYHLPETMRVYARQQLEAAEAEVCDVRCVDHYGQVAWHLVEQGQRAWSSEIFQTLAASQLNLRDAIRWCLAHDRSPERATSMLLALWGLAHNGRAEAIRELGERILERWPEPRDATWTVAAAVTANATLSAGDIERGRELAMRALATGHEGVGTVIAARGAYLAAANAGDDASALTWLERSLTTAETSRLEPFLIEGEVFRALTLASSGDVTAATEAAAKARERAFAGDSELMHVFAELAAAAIAANDDPVAAKRSLHEAITLARRHRYAWGAGAGHRALGALALVGGDLETARVELTRSLDVFVEVGQLGEVTGTLRWIAGLLVAAGQPDLAAPLYLPVAPSAPLLVAFGRDHLDSLLSGIAQEASPDVRLTIAAARAALEGLATAEPGSEAGSTAAVVPDTDAGAGRWILEGAVWELTYAGRTVRLPDAKGLSDLAVLLSRPGHEVAAAELMGAAVDSSDLGPAIDATARRAYEQRIVELQDDLEEAESFGDLRRAERARAELDQLIDVLTAATGLAGRSRRQGGSDEKARSAVTRRMRDAMRRIEDLHPELGAHLAASVRTGRWCVYEPAVPSEWAIRSRS